MAVPGLPRLCTWAPYIWQTRRFRRPPRLADAVQRDIPDGQLHLLRGLSVVPLQVVEPRPPEVPPQEDRERGGEERAHQERIEEDGHDHQEADLDHEVEARAEEDGDGEAHAQPSHGDEPACPDDAELHGLHGAGAGRRAVELHRGHEEEHLVVQAEAGDERDDDAVRREALAADPPEGAEARPLQGAVLVDYYRSRVADEHGHRRRQDATKGH
mmetsp:Transcript_15268/g.43661  ORF Transcript_15268/g.43661 Transcript_15268/m.43661 type:complete len:214 (-) Transcript_15268:660-1301(-)